MEMQQMNYAHLISRLPARARVARPLLAVSLAILAAGSAAPAWSASFRDVYDFGVNNQYGPLGQLALGRNGYFYGMNGATESAGIYQMTLGGTETLLWQSGGYPNQDIPSAGLTLGPDGLLYGTFYQWNNNQAAGGAIFQYNRAKGSNGLKALYVFPQVNPQGSSANPSQLVLGTDGNFYGTAFSGYSGDPNEFGSVFRITPKGVFTTLYTFQGAQANDGSNPNGLTLGADGNFYGVTEEGGNNGVSNAGTAFRMTPAGALTILTTFNNNSDGQNPIGRLVQGNDGNFYGSTYLGGANNQGTLFKMTPAGAITYLHDFNENTDHAGYPTQPLIQGSDGRLYGASTNCYAGSCSTGSLFRINTAGAYTDLYDFPPPCQNCEQLPDSPLLQHPNGVLHGVTQFGGSAAEGSFYRLGVGAVPIVSLLLPIGAPGATIGIFGSGFTGATGVAFNGTAASFTVVSNTYMTATVPVGATPGFVTVTEPSRTLQSGTIFTPQ
jgi:uncharacterized repeat protein (TIGR03803 family)